MKRILTLMAVVSLLCSASVAETLTVGDGASTDFLPGFIQDDGQGFVSSYNSLTYRAGLLEEMAGSNIVSLTFYSTTAPDWSRCSYADCMTVRQEGDVYLSVLTFAEPIEYSGGDFEFDIRQDWTNSRDGYGIASFYGVYTDVYHEISGWDSWYDERRQDSSNFLPKTTFTYEPQAASGTLTVCDGGQTHYIPGFLNGGDIYGSYCWMSYPASMLADMVGNKVTSMTFYSTTAPDWSRCRYADQMTVRQEGDVYLSVLTFAEPIIYSGGPFELENSQDWEATRDGYGQSSFYGMDVNDGAWAHSFEDGYVPAWQGDATIGFNMFLPKTTFTYEPLDVTGTPGIVANPVEKRTEYAVTFDYPEGETEATCTIYYRYSFDDGEYTEWQSWNDGDTLIYKEHGNYTFEAYAVGAGKTPSDKVQKTFTIDNSTGVSEADAARVAVATRRYDLSGRTASEQAAGVIITVTTWSDGTVSTTKTVK